jgi:hypothetical protein
MLVARRVSAIKPNMLKHVARNAMSAFLMPARQRLPRTIGHSSVGLDGTIVMRVMGEGGWGGEGMSPTTNRERVLDYLWSVGADGASNGDIVRATDIQPHQQVYILTQQLMRVGRIKGERRPGGWVFWADESPAVQLASPGRAHPSVHEPALLPRDFEALAQRVMSKHFGEPLALGQVTGVPKRFDLVSADGQIVGDAKYFTLVGGERLPPAKFSVIAEHVWLLEKTNAGVCFLVFGHDRRVPELWLKRYGKLAGRVQFFFLSDEGQSEALPAG